MVAGGETVTCSQPRVRQLYGYAVAQQLLAREPPLPPRPVVQSSRT